PGPDGTVVAADKTTRGPHDSFYINPNTIYLRAPRNGYVSFFLAVKEPGATSYSLSLRFGGKSAGIEPDLFKVWYHRLNKSGLFIPDALIPVPNPFHSSLPDPENRVPEQIAQGFWVDLWIPSDAEPGLHEGWATVATARRKARLRVHVAVCK